MGKVRGKRKNGIGDHHNCVEGKLPEVGDKRRGGVDKGVTASEAEFGASRIYLFYLFYVNCF